MSNHLKLVHSVKTPEVETAESKEPGIDQHQNELAAVDRVRRMLFLHRDSLNPEEHKTELAVLLVLLLTVQGYEDGLKESEAERRKTLKQKWKERKE